jgi:hypothetical protein
MNIQAFCKVFLDPICVCSHTWIEQRKEGSRKSFLRAKNRKQNPLQYLWIKRRRPRLSGFYKATHFHRFGCLFCLPFLFYFFQVFVLPVKLTFDFRYNDLLKCFVYLDCSTESRWISHRNGRKLLALFRSFMIDSCSTFA